MNVIDAIRITDQLSLAGLRRATARLHFATDLIVLGLKRAGHMHFPPPADLPLQVGDIFAVCGTRDQLRTIESACAGPA